MFEPSIHKVFASRDAIFHEKGDEANKDNNYERWHILLEVEDKKEVEYSVQQNLEG